MILDVADLSFCFLERRKNKNQQYFLPLELIINAQSSKNGLSNTRNVTVNSERGNH